MSTCRIEMCKITITAIEDNYNNSPSLIGEGLGVRLYYPRTKLFNASYPLLPPKHSLPLVIFCSQAHDIDTC